MRERPKRVQGAWLPEHNYEMARLSKVAVARNISHEQTSAAIKDFVRSSGNHFGSTSDGTRQALLWRLAEEIEGVS
jgi:hypothetical protein